MKQLIKDFLWFLFKRNSTMASCLIIDLAQYLSIKDTKDASDYLKAIYNIENMNNIEKEK